MADFMAQIRRALPGAEIVHNALWFAGDDDPQVRRQLLAADLIEIERGFEDAGLTGGDGRYGFGTLLGFIDRRHADGQGVILDGGARSATQRMYGLASYFLVSSGRDALGERHRRLAGRLVVGGLRRGPGRRGQRALPRRRRRVAARLRQGRGAAQRARRAHAPGRAPCRRPRPRRPAALVGHPRSRNRSRPAALSSERRGRDSNPRTRLTPVTRFPVVPVQPLRHLSWNAVRG